jgi:hypothetical protein
MEAIQTGKADAGIAADPVLFDALVHWKTVHYSSGTAVRPWLLSADVLRAGASLLGWGIDLGSQVIKPILSNFYTRRTMRTGVKLPDGNTVYPAQDILPHSINVRKVEHREDDPIRQQLAELGKEYADNLFKFDSADVPEVAMTGTQAGETSKDISEIMMSFGVHREAVIIAFDPRTIEISNKKGSSLYGNKEKLERHFTKVADTLPIPSDARRMLQRPQAATMSSLVLNTSSIC